MGDTPTALSEASVIRQVEASALRVNQQGSICQGILDLGDHCFRVPSKVLISLGGFGQQSVEWLQDMCTTQNKPMIQVDKS